jgi:2-keto-4-pentenoate hydratase/2-oxohepta-3-ene-1,7-dioic acid hydratase in catechol pathway
MRLCRFDDQRLGLVEGGEVLDVTPAIEAAIPPVRWPPPPGDALLRHLDGVRAAIARLLDSAPRRALGSVRLLSPVASPSKIIAAPVNYAKHLQEATADPATFHAHQLKRIEETGLFLKASSSLVGPGEGIPLRHAGRRTDHEIELVAVIGRVADRVSGERALEHVAGYAVGLDMSVRGPEERSFRKSIDGYTVLGPWLATPEEVGDAAALDLALHVNGELRQRANTRDLLVDLPRLIEWASSQYTLHPGDLIFTGTPEGVGPVQAGDVILASIGGVGEMQVEVRSSGEAPR